MTLLNLGCGNRHLPGWTNIDFVSASPAVIAHDLSKGIPMPDNSCDLVYHSHVLEHFGKEAGAGFIGECFRVLKKEGVIRIAVPDLEGLAKQYVAMLEKVRKEDNAVNRADYEWSVIELMDQMVRRKSGGEMFRYWQQPNIINQQTVESRLGHEFTQWRQQFLKTPATAPGKPVKPGIRAALKERWRNYCLRTLMLDEQKWQSALFEHSGEKHRWMYDSYSLALLLQEAGFTNAAATTAFESRFNGWHQYLELDVEQGSVRKPDSLFMEATKPGLLS